LVLYQFRIKSNGSSDFPYASSGMCDLTGIHPRELEKNANQFLQLIHPEDYVSVMESIQASAKGLDLWACDFRILHPNDTIIWVRGKANPEKLSDGSILWHGYFHNISDFKLAESELLRSKGLMNDIEANSKTGGWEYTVETGEAYWTDELYKIHEMENEPGYRYLVRESLKCYSFSKTE
jgi:PAS domain-containing protein